MSPPADSQPATSTSTLSDRHICLVGDLDAASEAEGRVGPTTVALAQKLAQKGHAVTIVSCESSSVLADESSHGPAGLHPRIRVVQLPKKPQLATPCGRQRTSFALFHWLRGQSFDVVVWPQRGGLGFHTLSASEQGLGFPSTLFCTVAALPSQTRLDSELPTGNARFRIDFMERRCLAQSDLLLAKSDDTLAWLRQEQFKLPADSHIVLPVDDSEAVPGAWLRAICETPLPHRPSALAKLADMATPPLVTVGLVTFNRPSLLRQAVDSLLRQDYPHLEVILVDDGSSDPQALALLDELSPTFASRGWHIIRQQNRYLGAARNAAAHMAQGKFLLFMDDDNVAKPHEVRTLVAVAELTQVDILTCHLERFSSTESPLLRQVPTEEWGPLGAALAAGLVENVFGDAGALILRRTFLALGGFTEVYGVGHEDWELFAKACLQGYRLEVVPEPLFYYRVLPGSMLTSSKQRANLLRSASPYLHGQPLWIRQLLLGYLGQHLALYAPSGGQPVLTDAQAVSDDEVLRLKNRIYDALRPYPRALNLLRRSAQAVLSLGRTH